MKQKERWKAMNDTISRNDALDLFGHGSIYTSDDAQRMIKNLPSAENSEYSKDMSQTEKTEGTETIMEYLIRETTGYIEKGIGTMDAINLACMRRKYPISIGSLTWQHLCEYFGIEATTMISHHDKQKQMAEKESAPQTVLVSLRCGNDKPTILCVSGMGNASMLIIRVEDICHDIQEKIDSGFFPHDGFMDTADGKADYAITRFTEAGYFVTFAHPFEIEV